MKKQITLLVIDSNEDYARGLSSYAKEYPSFLDASYLTGGDKITETIDFIRPDVIVADLLIPGMDIMRLLRSIKTIYGENKPYIIIHSLAISTPVMRSAAEYGADYFMVKPQPYSEICKTISDLAELNDCTAVSPNPQEESIDMKITHFLHSMGIPAHLNGYNYIRSSLKIAINDISALDPITKKLYPMIGKKYDKSPQCIERSIRHAIKVSWERGNKKIIYDIFGISPENLCRYYPTNSEYLAMLADDLRLRLKHNVMI